MAIGVDELCSSARGLNGEHVLTAVSRDCGGNVETRSVPFTVSVPSSACSKAVPRDLVVNEVDYDQGSEDAGEFVEITNVGTKVVNLDGYALRVYYYGPFETQPRFARYERYPMDSVELAPGDYFVVCAAENPGAYCNQRVTPVGWGLLPQELLPETSPAAVALVYSETGIEHLDRLVDSVCYIGSETPGDPGSGIPGELPGGALTETLCNSQLETEPGAGVSRVPDGSDSDSNLADLRQACITPGVANAASVESCESGGESLGRLVINELDVNQPQHPDPAEFVEIYNAGASGVHLADYLLVHRYLDQVQSFYPIEKRLRLPEVVLAPGELFVTCRNPLVGCQDERLFGLHDPNGVLAIVHNVTGRPEHDHLVDSVAYGLPDAAFEGGPAGGGLWIEGLPIGELDGATAVDALEGVGFSRTCSGADTDGNSSDFRLAPVTPGEPNLRP